ncbi:MAG: hypothetical protein FWE43_02920 [Streptococcaceae bacterium]|nr:hypothetical protein [Streptococcaceae bacterium]MCL2681415.1 hypothetical protein [Streptococcaceae bacterium]
MSQNLLLGILGGTAAGWFIGTLVFLFYEFLEKKFLVWKKKRVMKKQNLTEVQYFILERIKERAKSGYDTEEFCNYSFCKKIEKEAFKYLQTFDGLKWMRLRGYVISRYEYNNEKIEVSW